RRSVLRLDRRPGPLTRRCLLAAALHAATPAQQVVAEELSDRTRADRLRRDAPSRSGRRRGGSRGRALGCRVRVACQHHCTRRPAEGTQPEPQGEARLRGARQPQPVRDPLPHPRRKAGGDASPPHRDVRGNAGSRGEALLTATRHKGLHHGWCGVHELRRQRALPNDQTGERRWRVRPELPARPGSMDSGEVLHHRLSRVRADAMVRAARGARQAAPFLAVGTPLTWAHRSAALGADVRAQQPFEVHEKSITELQAAMRAGEVTARQLVDAYIARIDAYDRRGPSLNSIIVVHPRAREIADSLDGIFVRTGEFVGPLHGIPIIVKDNYDTYDLPTTAGSASLADSVPPQDATMVAKLRAAGAIVLAKPNMAEFAFSPVETIGSALPGYTFNP